MVIVMESKMIVKIEKLNEEGKGIVYIDNNLIEIEGALPNDEIEIIITKKLRDRYLAKIHRFIKESEERENHCKLSGICGGCDFVNYVYEKQKRYKENQIIRIEEVVANNFFTMNHTLINKIYSNIKRKCYVFTRENNMGCGAKVYVDVTTGLIIG